MDMEAPNRPGTQPEAWGSVLYPFSPAWFLGNKCVPEQNLLDLSVTGLAGRGGTG